VLVSRSENVLTISSMAVSALPSAFVFAMSDGMNRGYADFLLNFDTVQATYPNACVPFAGLIRYYQRFDEIDFTFTNCPEAFERFNILRPLSAESELKSARSFPLNRVWSFRDIEAVNALVSGFRDAVAQAAVCEHGVLEGLEWSLNEVMDNVLQHSGADEGFVMGQIHAQSKHVALCVFDYGQGILNSLVGTKYTPRTAGDAITLALQEGVTRNTATNQGNGLWGLNNIVSANSGRMAISSGQGHYLATGSIVNVANKLQFPSHEHSCTTVDFQIDFDKAISLPEALGGHEPVNIKLDSLDDGAGNLRMQISDWSFGTGTRKSGLAIRNEVLNLMSQSPLRMIIDFTGVGVIASSFADEFLGRLVTDMGVAGFMSRIELRGMNGTVQAIANRSIAQRISQVTNGT
jgi:hypothetical protein